tara:strand:- start:968 stop:1114 length:147 start_codon:yes stop_codon:yes gene_type:complete
MIIEKTDSYEMSFHEQQKNKGKGRLTTDMEFMRHSYAALSNRGCRLSE